MENSIVLEGVSVTADDKELEAAVGKHCGRVIRTQRLPSDGAVFLQFGLENQALFALGSLCCSLRDSLPSSFWQDQSQQSCGNVNLQPPRARTPSCAEYEELIKVTRDTLRSKRRQRFLDSDCTPMEDYFEHVFDFSDADMYGDRLTSMPDPFQINALIWLDNQGTGSSLWSCGLLLGECLWQGILPVRGKQILELGCGCAAVPSIVAAHVGAKHVVATDFVSEVLDNATQNAGKHGVEVLRLDWSDHAGLPSGQTPAVEKAQVLLWSDAVYTELGGLLLARAVAAHADVGALIAAVIPEQDRPGMEIYEQEMRCLGYARTSDVSIPASVAEKAAKRYQISSGLVSTTKGNALKSRLLQWESLYD